MLQAHPLTRVARQICPNKEIQKAFHPAAIGPRDSYPDRSRRALRPTIFLTRSTTSATGSPPPPTRPLIFKSEGGDGSLLMVFFLRRER